MALTISSDTRKRLGLDVNNVWQSNSPWTRHTWLTFWRSALLSPFSPHTLNTWQVLCHLYCYSQEGLQLQIFLYLQLIKYVSINPHVAPRRLNIHLHNLPSSNLLAAPRMPAIRVFTHNPLITDLPYQIYELGHTHHPSHSPPRWLI